MKRVLQLCFSLLFFAIGFSNVKPIPEKVKKAKEANRNFVKYSPFTVDNTASKIAKYEKAADDITVMQLKSDEIAKIITEQPVAMEMSFPFEGKELTVELVKHEIFTNSFRVNTDKGYTNYTPGVYYQGIIKGDEKSVVAFSFFNGDIVGVASAFNVGNIVVGKTKDSKDFVAYNDAKLKESNPFSCGADMLPENKKPAGNFDPKAKDNVTGKTTNCVRIYYEVGFGPYNLNGSNVTQTVNWATAMHNNVQTLYANDNITVALSEVFVWTTTDPYTGTPSQILNKFRTGRPTFNGDVASLLRNPATTSIAFVNALCTNYNYNYNGVNLSFQNVPTYSWNIEAMTHEIGHNLASPHTHACFWNGDNTAIDGCGPASGNNEGCDAPLPTNGGTIMSYCHLVAGVGINFAHGFGEQPATLIRNTIESKGCLGMDCVNSCEMTITGASLSDVTDNSATVTISDNQSTSWKYRVSKYDGTVVTQGTSNDKVITITGLEPANYYKVEVGTSCSGPEAFQRTVQILTDADWCSGVVFTDTGGENGDYGNGEIITKTFYPANPNQKLKMTFTEFDTESNYDFFTVYDGTHTGAPRLVTNHSGNTIPGPFEATNAAGALTVRFISDQAEVGAGWKATFECVTLGISENALKNEVSLSPNPTKGNFVITSKEKIISYEVYDATGKIVKQASKLNASVEGVNLAGYPAGTYVVKIKTATETVSRKVIKL